MAFKDIAGTLYIQLHRFHSCVLYTQFIVITLYALIDRDKQK